MRKIKIGLFGVGMRGKSFYDNIRACSGEIVAVCDFNEGYLKNAKEALGAELATYSDFDDFINHEGLEAILVSNYFHEHAPYSIKALAKDLHVLSECSSNGTMADGVALVRACEKSKAFFMIAENYPYMIFNQEMRRVYQSGVLGKAIFCEGEYNHPLDPKDFKLVKHLCPSSKHWRYNLPRAYYVTHALAPLMLATGAFPKRLSCMPCYCPGPNDHVTTLTKGVPEKAAIITILNDDSSVFRVTGCAAFGHHENSYRICGENGQIENLRDGTDRVLLSFDEWSVPEGMKRISTYSPEWDKSVKAEAEKAGHGGGDYFVIKEFFDCIREGRRPVMDEYFATAMASVGILAHRSMLENGTTYDVPDFRKEEDRALWENDRISPFFGTDGSVPTIRSTNFEDFNFTEEAKQSYDELMKTI